jgi:uncharacterized protein YkwD
MATQTKGSMPSNDLKKMKTIRQQLQQKLSLLWAFVVLGLIGCEAITDVLPPLPKQDAPVSKSPTPSPAAQSAAIAEMEAQIRQQINEIRQQNGLNSLQNNEKLAQVARNYSQLMARDNFFSHTGSDGSTLAQRVRSARIFYIMVGENLFTSTNIPQPVPLAVHGWMKSPGHRENILRPVFTQTGVGIWREGNTYYITQLFMRPLI